MIITKLSKELIKIWMSKMASERKIKKWAHAVKFTGKTGNALIPALCDHEVEEYSNNDFKI